MHPKRFNMKIIPTALVLAGTVLAFPAGNFAFNYGDGCEETMVEQRLVWQSVLLSDEQGKQAPDFELEDQFRSKKIHQFPKDKWSIIFVAGRKGSEQIEPWAKAIYDTYGDSVEQIGIADVSNVPGPLQGLIRSLFRKTITYPILMDWEGSVVQKLGYKKDQVRLVVVSPEGKIKEVFDGPLTKSAKARVFKAVPESEKTKP